LPLDKKGKRGKKRSKKKREGIDEHTPPPTEKTTG